MTSLSSYLTTGKTITIKQQKELTELIGFETRNKYAIENDANERIGYAAEQQKGIGAFLFRQALGHWRTYTVNIFDNERKVFLEAYHPFRFIFQRLEIKGGDGRKVGALQQRFGIIRKKFDIEDATGRVVLTISSPIWKIWTFPVLREGNEVGKILKKWGGMLKEAFIDADTFAIEFNQPNFSADERALVMTAGIFVDLTYFERKGSGGGLSS